LPRLVLKRLSEEKIRLLKAEAARRGMSLSEAVEEAIELWARSPGGTVGDEAADDAAWEALRERLRREALGKYVVIAEGRLVGVYGSLEEAAEALRKLRRRGVRRALLIRPGVDDERAGEAEWLGGSMEAETAGATSPA